MAKHVPFRLITPTAVVFDGEAELVIVTGTEGEVGILPAHAPFLTALKPGVLRANLAGEGGAASRLELATSGGFLLALPGRIVVLVDQALAPEKVDGALAKSELDEAMERQKSAGGDRAVFAREQERIDFANAKLTLAGQRL
jgi:F-type H+-transporting ATPase subunit epsilon